ncbi:MAG: hypothetical protein Q8934_21665 [Bacillota bacterium]|nr:hypothetical protein [Bacillota bacterium]
MKAPVDMKIGGSTIFLAVAGFLAAFRRTNKTRIAMQAAPIEEIRTILFINYSFLVKVSFEFHYILNEEKIKKHLYLV